MSNRLGLIAAEANGGTRDSRPYSYELIDETLGARALLPPTLLDYAQLSTTSDQFKDFVAAVDQMRRTQPNVCAQQLPAMRVPVVIAHSERDEFIKREHSEYPARSIPGV